MQGDLRKGMGSTEGPEGTRDASGGIELGLEKGGIILHESGREHVMGRTQTGEGAGTAVQPQGAMGIAVGLGCTNNQNSNCGQSRWV